MEYRLSSIMFEISTKKQELAKLEERAKETRKPAESAMQQSKENRLKPHL